MEPMNEVYVVLSGKDLVYVTLNKSDAEGLQYRLTEACIDATVYPAVLVTQERYRELANAYHSWLQMKEKGWHIDRRTKEMEELRQKAKDQEVLLESYKRGEEDYIRRAHDLVEALSDSKMFAAHLNKQVQWLSVHLEEKEKQIEGLKDKLKSAGAAMSDIHKKLISIQTVVDNE